MLRRDLTLAFWYTFFLFVLGRVLRWVIAAGAIASKA
jgi:hypothetical protein